MIGFKNADNFCALGRAAPHGGRDILAAENTREKAGAIGVSRADGVDELCSRDTGLAIELTAVIGKRAFLPEGGEQDFCAEPAAQEKIP